MLNRIIIAGALSLVGSATLALIFAACATGRFDLSTLNLPGVIQVALLTSMIIAILITPLTAWAYKQEKIVYFVILWVLLSVIILLINTKVGFGAIGLYGPIVLGLIGVIVIGLIR